MKKLEPIPTPKLVPRSTKRFTMMELKQKNIDLREQYRKLQVAHDRAIANLKDAKFDLKVCRFKLGMLKEKFRLIDQDNKTRPTAAKIMSDLAKRSREK